MRGRYVLFRGRRVFADVIAMTESLRLAIHLGRVVKHSAFFKMVNEGKQTLKQ